MPFPKSNSRAIRVVQQKLFNSRFFTISVLFHLVLLVALGGTVIMKQATEPPDFTGGDGDSKFVQNEAAIVPPPPPPLPDTPALTPTTQNNTALDAITTAAPTMSAFQLPTVVPVAPPAAVEPAKMTASPVPANPQQLTTAQAKRIRDFTNNWSKPVKGFGGLGSSVKERQFQFVAYLAKYQGGDWASTNIVKDGKIVKGSLPNLLYFMNKLSKGRIKADTVPEPLDLSNWEQEVSVKKPPFIFFTGHRDFVLTDAEVDCLQKYVQSGGCIWGDSSLPGRHSRFDLAFRREMRRVIPDLDKEWEVLPPNYPMFTKNLYYAEITAPTTGVNHYKEPVYALRFGGEVAIIYTANDYGDMWRLALTQVGDKLEIDKTLMEGTSIYKFTDNAVFARMEIYYRGMELPKIINSYKFGTNVVIHLLTRWEDRIKAIPQGL
ncbi:MAG: DUF4159 domain-containing protein [Verrucomicrobia bacterium]|nr:DUF4159 domain-containing protein [Verrucomicrobiota bacterium]